MATWIREAIKPIFPWSPPSSRSSLDSSLGSVSGTASLQKPFSCARSLYARSLLFPFLVCSFVLVGYSSRNFLRKSVWKMQKELWSVFWGWVRLSEKGKAWSGEPFPSLGSRPCWRRLVVVHSQRWLDCPGQSQAGPTLHLCRWTKVGRGPEGMGASGQVWGLPDQRVFALWGLQETNLWGTGNSSQWIGTQERGRVSKYEDGICVHITTGSGPELWDYCEVTGAENHSTSSHTQDTVQVCSGSQKQSKHAPSRTRKGSLLPPARCLQRPLLTKLNTVLCKGGEMLRVQIIITSRYWSVNRELRSINW